jgi:hypothetical protein
MCFEKALKMFCFEFKIDIAEFAVTASEGRKKILKALPRI